MFLPAMDQVMRHVISLAKNVDHANGMLASLNDPDRPLLPSTTEVKDIVRNLYRPIASLLFQELFSPGLADLIHNLVPTVIEAALNDQHNARANDFDMVHHHNAEADERTHFPFTNPSYLVENPVNPPNSLDSTPVPSTSVNARAEQVKTDTPMASRRASVSRISESLKTKIYTHDQDANGTDIDPDEEQPNLSALPRITKFIPIHTSPAEQNPIFSNASLHDQAKLPRNDSPILPRSVYEECPMPRHDPIQSTSLHTCAPLEETEHALSEVDHRPSIFRDPELPDQASWSGHGHNEVIDSTNIHSGKQCGETTVLKEGLSGSPARELKNQLLTVWKQEHGWFSRNGVQLLVIILLLISIALFLEPRKNSAKLSSNHPLWSAIQQSRVIS